MINAITDRYVSSIQAPIDDTVSKHRYQGWKPCIEWCEEHFGPVDFYNKDNGRWYRNMMFGYQDYHFAEEADASFFTLFWLIK